MRPVGTFQEIYERNAGKEEEDVGVMVSYGKLPTHLVNTAVGSRTGVTQNSEHAPCQHVVL